MNDKKISQFSKTRRVIRVLLRIFVVVLLLLFSIILALNIPAVQTYISKKLIKSISEKTGTTLSVGSIKISFPKTVDLQDVFVEDQQEDTLLYLHSLKIEVGLLKLFSKKIEINNLEIENLVTHIHRKNSAEAFNFQFILDSLGSKTPDTTDTTSTPWMIDGEKIALKNIRGTFTDEHNDFNLIAYLENFEAVINDLNIEKQKIDLEKFLLKNSTVQIISNQKVTAIITASLENNEDSIANGNIEKEKVPSLIPGWELSINQFALENSNFQIDNNAFPKLPEQFDERHILARNINAGIRNFKSTDDVMNAEINNFSLNESCGFTLEKFTVDAKLSEQQVELKNLQIKTSKSNVIADASIKYSSFHEFLSDFINCESEVELKNTNVNANEFFLFAPSLSIDSLAGKFRNSDILISAKAKGKLNNLNVDELEISVLQNTFLKTHGTVTGLPEMSKLSFDVEVDQFSTVLPDAYKFIDRKSLGDYNLPEAIALNGSIKGKTNSIQLAVQMNSAYGNISAKSFYQKRNEGEDTLNLVFSLDDIHAGTILRDSMLGNLNISGNTEVLRKGKTLFYGSANMNVDDIEYKEYHYKDIRFDNRLDGDVYTSTVNSADSNLHFELLTTANLHEEIKKYTTSLNLSNLNFQALNFTPNNFSVSTNLKAGLNYQGINNAEANLNLENTKLNSDEKIVPVDTFIFNAISKPEGIDVRLRSDLVDGTFSGNIKAENLKGMMQTAFNKYLGRDSAQGLEPGKQLSVLMHVHLPTDIINLVDPKLEILEIDELKGDYNSDNNALTFEAQIARMKYANVLVDTVTLTMNGNNEKLSLECFLRKVSYNNIRIERFRVKEETDNGKILSEISIRDYSDSLKYLFANELAIGKDFFNLRFLSDGLILDGHAWKIDEGNLIERKSSKVDNVPAKISFQHFVFNSDSASFGIIKEDSIQKIEFRNFAIEDLVSIAEYYDATNSNGKRSKLVRGNLNGDISLPSIKNPNGTNANLSITNLYILDTLFGSLQCNLTTGNDKMDVDFRMENEENKINLIGYIDHLSETPLLNLDASFDLNNLRRVEHFSFGTLSKMSGKIDGKISLKGTTSKPEISGYIGFDKTALRINSLNLYAKIQEEKITLSNEGIHFDNFEIEDLKDKKLTINGDLLTKDLNNLGFDLSIVTKKFQPVNSTVQDNKTFFGTLSIETEINLKGNMKNPVIDATIRIDSATNLTYALPGSELKLVSAEGIVQFMDSVQAFDSTLMAQQADYLTDSIMSRIKGMIVDAHLELDPGAVFTVDIDPKSGDYLTVRGKAKLDISSDKSGKQTINGTYEVSSGAYQLSFYDLVKKKFTITPGSTIIWSGRPMDGDMNITAEYVVRTSSVALVANETASMSDEEKKIFNRRLPYEIKLNIRGLISKPEISFNITLPNQYLSDNPLVASKLTQLNLPEMADQLNKQVFALLVAGTFMAESPIGNTGSTNIASTAARNSVNGILSSQLNNMSSKYISTVDVNFGLTSYEDYSTGSGSMQTEMDIQVSKKLMNDRLVVEAENSFGLKDTKKQNAGTSQQGYGQFAVIYNLTPSGVYKLRAYYQNAYDPFDGDISFSGIAFIFEKEFDTLKRKRIMFLPDGKKNTGNSDKK